MTFNLPTQDYTLVIGPTAAGKTCILWRIRFGEFLGDPRPTPGLSDPYKIGDNYIYELGGHQSFQTLLDPLVQDASLIIFVIDITKEDDFEAYQNFVKKYPHETLILATNKIDQLDPSKNYQDYQDLITAYPKFRDIKHIVPCSAKTGDGIWKLREIINQSKKTKSTRKITDQLDRQLEYREEETKEALSEARKVLDKFRGKLSD
ncbi:MAG: ADP-ribosylation factor-like protein [Candidatus Hermodarchaeota archaeon]